MGAGTPRPAPLLTQRSGSRPPGPGPGVAPGHAKPGTPMSTSTPGGHPPTRPGSADALAKRGKKRELEEEGSVPPPATAGAIMVGGATQRRPVVGATPASAGSVPGKSGVPRPHKKPRTVSSYIIPVSPRTLYLMRCMIGCYSPRTYGPSPSATTTNPAGRVRLNHQ